LRILDCGLKKHPESDNPKSQIRNPQFFLMTICQFISMAQLLKERGGELLNNQKKYRICRQVKLALQPRTSSRLLKNFFIQTMRSF
jgi:hypothetical protein